MINAALIGVSGFGNVHYQDLLREVEEGHLKVTAATIINQDEEPEKCRKLRLLGCELFTDYREMLKQFHGCLDLCCIPTGIHLHAPMSIDAMRAGVNVLVEKPAAATIQDVRAMQAVEHETGRFTAVGFQHIYGDDALAIKRLLVEKRLGNIQSIKCMGMGPRLDSYYARNTWAGRLQVDGHIVLDSPFNNAFAHYLNLICFFAGTDETASARPENIIAELFRAHDIESCDTASLRIETAEGIRLHFFVTHCSEEGVNPLIRIKGEAGTLNWEQGKPCRLQFHDGRVEELPSENPAHLRKKIMDRVLSRIQNQETFICSLDIAGAQTLCANAAHLSCQIRTVPAMHVKRVPEHDDVKTIIVGIDNQIRQAFESEKLFCESGVPWAVGLKPKLVEAGSLREYINK